MSYIKQTWADHRSGGTPITADRLTHIEDGIEAASEGQGTLHAAAHATGQPDAISPGTIGAATAADIAAAIAALVDSSPANLDTLNELAAALGDDANFAATVTAALAAKVASNDARLSDARTPSGAAGGVLAGTYPNPGFAADMATQAELDAVIADLSGTTVPLSVIDAAGDLIVGTGADTVGRLAKGTALDVLRVNAGATALEWAAPSSGAAGAAASLRDKYLAPTGALYETFPRWNQMASISPGPHLILSIIVLPTGLVVGRIAHMNVGANSGASNWWMGLFDSSLNLLAVSANQGTALWAANTVASLPIATTAAGAQTTFTTTYEGVYYLGVMQTATTPSTLKSASSVNTVAGDLAPGLGFTKANGPAAPPAFPYQATAPVATGNQLAYGYVSA